MPQLVMKAKMTGKDFMTLQRQAFETMMQLADEGDLPSQVPVLRNSHQAPDTRVCATSRPKSPQLRALFDNAGLHEAEGMSSSVVSELSALDDVLELECIAWDFADTVTGRDQDILFSDLPSSPDSTKEIQWITIPITVEGVEASSHFRSTSASSPQVLAITPSVNSGESFRRSESPVISYVPLITHVGKSTVIENENHILSSLGEPSSSEQESISPLSHRDIAEHVEATEYHNSRDAEMGWACALPSTALSVGIPDPCIRRETASEISRIGHDGKSDRLRTRLISAIVDEDGRREISQDLLINGPHTPSVKSEHSSSEVASAQICGNTFSVYKAFLPAGVSSSPQHSSLAAPSQSRAPLGAPVATNRAFFSWPLSIVHGISTPRRADPVDIVANGQSPLKAAKNVDPSIPIGTDVGLSPSDSSASITRSSLMPPPSERNHSESCLPLLVDSRPRPPLYLSVDVPCGNASRQDLSSASTSSRQSDVSYPLPDTVGSDSRSNAACATLVTAWTSQPQPTDTRSVISGEAISNHATGNSTVSEPLRPLLDDVVIQQHQVHETCSQSLSGQKTSLVTKSLRISRTPKKGKHAASNYSDAEVQTEPCTLTGSTMSSDMDDLVHCENLQQKILRLEAEVKELKIRNHQVQERSWAHWLSCEWMWRSMISEDSCHERVQVSAFPDLHFATRFTR